MPTTQSPTETALTAARLKNAMAQLRRRYDELDKLTGKNAAERVEELLRKRKTT